MVEYKITFVEGEAGFSAKNKKEAHKIAREYAEGRNYRLYYKATRNFTYYWKFMQEVIL